MGGKSVPFPRRFGRVLRPSNLTGVVEAEEKKHNEGSTHNMA